MAVRGDDLAVLAVDPGDRLAELCRTMLLSEYQLSSLRMMSFFFSPGQDRRSNALLVSEGFGAEDDDVTCRERGRAVPRRCECRPFRCR